MRQASLVPDFMRRPDGGVFYGWWLVVIGAFIIAVAGSGIGLPLFRQYAFEVHRADPDFSLPAWTFYFYSVLGAASSVLLPVIGMAIDRWGSRRPMLVGLPLVGIGLLLAGLSPRVVVVNLISPLVSLGSELSTYLPAVTAVNHWFRRRRTMAMAMMMFGVAVAEALVKEIPGPVGQTAILATGLAVLVAAGPLAFLVRNRPEPHGEHPDGIEASCQEAVPEYSVGETIRTREFWMLALATICLSAAGSIVTISAPQLMQSRGVYPLQLDATHNISAMARVPFILVGGYVGHNFPLRRALFGFALLYLAAAVTLLAANDIRFFFLAAALLGMGTGGVQPLSIAALGAYFGRYKFATILGIYLVISQLLTGAGFTVVSLLGYLNANGVLQVAAAAFFGAIGMAAYLLMQNPRPAPSQAPVTLVDQ